MTEVDKLAASGKISEKLGLQLPLFTIQTTIKKNFENTNLVKVYLEAWFIQGEATGRAPKRAAWGKSWSEKIAHSAAKVECP